MVHKLLPVTEAQRRAVDLVRQLIWWFYRDLKAWQCQPDRRRAAALRARFERIFRRRTGYVRLDRLLARLRERKAELLRVLDRPEIPLHTNGSENDIREPPPFRPSRHWSEPRLQPDPPGILPQLLSTAESARPDHQPRLHRHRL